LADNKILTFLCPPKVAAAWMETLRILTQMIKLEDPRMVWLKNQYLFLYYQDDLCMGPLAADAIKVTKSRKIKLNKLTK
jgi:phosphatidylinositol phospholipase C epsilon